MSNKHPNLTAKQIIKILEAKGFIFLDKTEAMLFT